MQSGSEKRRIVLGVTGSIAAYKSAELARYLITRGYQVRVVMTDSARQFIAPLTFEAITGHPVSCQFWDETQPGAISHIALADWADLVVIAPASADFVAKVAYGSAESPLLAVALATKAPLLLAPAMNVNMYEHPQTQANLKHLKGRGVLVIEPDAGPLACGWKGKGRLPHHREIFFHVRRALSQHDLRGRRVVVSTGPTREAIDPVRFLSNRSSGKMGVALACEAFRRGAEVTLVHGPIALPIKVPREVRCVPVVTALEMQEQMEAFAFGTEQIPAADIVVMAAAVADCRPERSGLEKIKKSELPSEVALVKNPDILATLGARKGSQPAPTLIGFAVETGDIENLLNEVRRKRAQKNVDMIVGNFASDAFDSNTNRVWLVSRSGREQEISTTYKSRIAIQIFDAITRL